MWAGYGVEELTGQGTWLDWAGKTAWRGGHTG